MPPIHFLRTTSSDGALRLMCVGQWLHPEDVADGLIPPIPDWTQDVDQVTCDACKMRLVQRALARYGA